MKLGVCVICTLSVSCVADHDIGRIDVATNDLGVTTLQIEQSHDRGTDVLAVHGFTADQRELASVRVTTGAIADIATWAVDDSDTGSEVVMSFGDTELRMVTLETQLIQIGPSDVADASIARFLQLPEVTATLHGAHVFVIAPPSPEQAYIGPIYPAESAFQGTPGMFINSTTSAQACYEDPFAYPNYSPAWTTFHFNPLNAPKNPGTVAVRYHNGHTPAACRGANGTDTCSGSACTYGPQGYTRPTTYLPPAGQPYGHIGKTTYAPNPTSYCNYSFSATPVANVWNDVVGTNDSNCGCCGNGSGPCCGTACSSCTSAPQSAALRAWNYAN